MLDLLYHWTAAQHGCRIREHGLQPSDAFATGGHLGFHRGEPAVCLVQEGELNQAFNPAVILSGEPVRVEVDTANLSKGLFAPDLNALLDPDIVYAARDKGHDLLDVAQWTADASLRWSGAVRYLGPIGPGNLRGPCQSPHGRRSRTRHIYTRGPTTASAVNESPTGCMSSSVGIGVRPVTSIALDLSTLVPVIDLLPLSPVTWCRRFGQYALELSIMGAYQERLRVRSGTD